jgi:hypothetical protein
MQSELTKHPDSYPNSTIELGDQRFIGGVLASDSSSDRLANKSRERIFVICDACFWATTYLDKSRLPVHDSRCSRCQEIGLSSFPVLADESFTYTYSERRGIELSFTSHRR